MKPFIISILRHWTTGLGFLLVGFGVSEDESGRFTSSLIEVSAGIIVYAIGQAASFARISHFKSIAQRFGFKA